MNLSVSTVHCSKAILFGIIKGDLHGMTFLHATTLRHDYNTNRIV